MSSLDDHISRLPLELRRMVWGYLVEGFEVPSLEGLYEIRWSMKSSLDWWPLQPGFLEPILIEGHPMLASRFGAEYLGELIQGMSIVLPIWIECPWGCDLVDYKHEDSVDVQSLLEDWAKILSQHDQIQRVVLGISFDSLLPVIVDEDRGECGGWGSLVADAIGFLEWLASTFKTERVILKISFMHDDDVDEFRKCDLDFELPITDLKASRKCVEQVLNAAEQVFQQKIATIQRSAADDPTGSIEKRIGYLHDEWTYYFATVRSCVYGILSIMEAEE